MPQLQPGDLAFYSGIAAWLIVIGLALARGGGPERWAAALLLANLAIIFVFPDPTANAVRWRAFVADLVVLGGVLWLCLSFRRGWLVWALGLQMAAVMVHVPRLLNPAIHNWAYGVLVNLSGYTVITALLAGVILEAPRHAPR